MNKVLTFGLITVLLGLSCAHVTSFAFAQSPPGRPSVLFLNIDDLNDWNEVLGGHPQAITPNLQRLAKRSMTFKRAICSSPVCFPSRTSVFTGIHPVKSGAISNFNWGKPWRFYVKDAVTIPKHFESQGYVTAGFGKNFHDRNKPEFQFYKGRPKEPKIVKGSGYFKGPLGWAIADVPYEEMPDHVVVTSAIEFLVSQRNPLFLSVGIYRPHVPWKLPKECFGKYPMDQFEGPRTTPNDLADLAPRLKKLAFNEAKFGVGFHAKLVDDGQDKAWARAYLASVTFADEQLGRLLDAWEASPQSQNGYIVLWSDHGFVLGEKKGWGKFKPWYDSIHSNLMISGPGVGPGKVCDKAVSLLDIYPTLVELLGLPKPAKQKLDGNSLVKLLTNPESDWQKPVTMSHEEDGIRYDVVLDNQYRMTQTITGECELYDLDADPNEWSNLVNDPDYDSVVERLSRHLTFSYPELPSDGWIEAEDLPLQTSADFQKRGNYHYRLVSQAAENETLVVCQLVKGKGSYADFILDVSQPGQYLVGAKVQQLDQNIDVDVLVDNVVSDGKQSDADWPMNKLERSIKLPKSNEWNVREQVYGSVTFEKPGLKVIRFMNAADKSIQLRVDKVLFRLTRTLR